MGAGQPSRVVSVQLALRGRATAPRAVCWGRTPSSPSQMVWSWPPRAAVTAVIQPGGSMRDQEVIKAANEHNIAMVFTGIRHFRH